MIADAEEKKYRIVIQVGGKTFLDSRVWHWRSRGWFEKEVKRLNQLCGVTAYIEAVVVEPGP